MHTVTHVSEITGSTWDVIFNSKGEVKSIYLNNKKVVASEKVEYKIVRYILKNYADEIQAQEDEALETLKSYSGWN